MTHINTCWTSKASIRNCQFLCTTTQNPQIVSHGSELWLMITTSLWQWLPFLYNSYKFHQASLPKPRTCQMLHTSYSSWSDHATNICWGVCSLLYCPVSSSVLISSSAHYPRTPSVQYAQLWFSGLFILLCVGD